MDIILHSMSTSEFKNIIAEAVKEELSAHFKDEMPDDYTLTKKDVCRMLKITCPTLDKRTREGKITASRTEGHIRYKYADIKKYMEDNKMKFTKG